MQVFGWNVWTSWKSPYQSVLFHAFFRYFEQMQNCQLQVDEIGYSALIRALVKGDRWHLRLHTCPKIQLSLAKDMEVVPIELESVHAAMLVLEYLHRWGTPLVKLESLSLCSLFLSDFWYSIANGSWLLANMRRAAHDAWEKEALFLFCAMMSIWLCFLDFSFVRQMVRPPKSKANGGTLLEGLTYLKISLDLRCCVDLSRSQCYSKSYGIHTYGIHNLMQRYEIYLQ